MPGLEQKAIETFIEQSSSQDISSSIQPLIENLHPLIRLVSALVGGLFGLYLIYILFRIHYERKSVNLLRDIRYDLDQLNQHFNLPHSQQKKGFIRMLFAKFKKEESSSETKKSQKKKK